MKKSIRSLLCFLVFASLGYLANRNIFRWKCLPAKRGFIGCKLDLADKMLPEVIMRKMARDGSVLSVYSGSYLNVVKMNRNSKVFWNPNYLSENPSMDDFYVDHWGEWDREHKNLVE